MKMSTITPSGYEKDFYAWTFHTADLLRHRKFEELDIENIAEEIESMGKSTKRELINRLAVLLAHLIKWKFEKERRCNSWKSTIVEQREETNGLIEDSPSLKYELNEKLDRAYVRAIKIASTEMGVSKDLFPKTCPFSLNESLNVDFFPE
jgi:hypothetical protein